MNEIFCIFALEFKCTTMEIKRDLYLNRLIDRRENGAIKVITGVRRCGKSYLLFKLFYKYLLSTHVDRDHIISIAFDDDTHNDLLEGKVLGDYIRSLISDDGMYYILLDEVQLVSGFEKVLNGLNRLENLDIYVTGSNSRFLSSDILTEFRGRGDEIRVYPLVFEEFCSVFEGNNDMAWNDFFTFGGMPFVLSCRTEEQKAKYLNDLMRKVYVSDIVDRNRLKGDAVMDSLLDVLASSVGSLTNPSKLSNTFQSTTKIQVSYNTIVQYIDYLKDAFLISEANRYDVKGKKYISTPKKYYFADVGLRNARLNFRQQEENHIMENILYNELLVRGFNVDVGVVEYNRRNEQGKQERVQLEVDFVCNLGSQRCYVQSAFAMPDKEKMEQEQNSLLRINDSFKKIIVVKDNIRKWYNESGVLIIGIQEFLLNSKEVVVY